jgi:ribonuclease HI
LPLDFNELLQSNYIVIFTDGGASGNPGPGGWGAVLLYGKHKKELGGGYKETTNNRMELLATIQALQSIKNKELPIALFSDSRYVVDGINKGWAKKWQANGWKKADKKQAENIDLWERLLSLCSTLQVEFHWVKGHSDIYYNDRCDTIAKEWMGKNDLPPDTIYEAKIKQKLL